MTFQAILDWEPLPYAVAGLAMLAAAPVVLIVKNSVARKRKRDAYPRDTVILHQIPRGPLAPSISPFPIKLETYLRFAKIPYENELSVEMSSKGKTPWMTYNGEDVADSQICIDYLNEKLDIDLNSHLSQQEKAIARAFLKMIEDSLYWCLVIHRSRIDSRFLMSLKFPVPIPLPIFLWMVRRKAAPLTRGQGMGRHSDKQVMDIFYRDLQGLSVFLGKKPFLMGDQPSEVDCSVFGMLSQMKWHMPESQPKNWIHGEFSNLSEYCDRMKERFWPDWENCITHGK